jgi:hypothetical protein
VQARLFSAAARLPLKAGRRKEATRPASLKQKRGAMRFVGEGLLEFGKRP